MTTDPSPRRALSGAVAHVVAAVAALAAFAAASLVAGPAPRVDANPACVSPAFGAADLNAAFAAPGLGATATQAGFGGGDYPHAYSLRDGRILWMFQDLHFSNDDDLRDSLTTAAHNAGLVQSGSCFTILGGRGLDVVGDPMTVDSRRWFWPLDGEIGADGLLWIFFAEMSQPDGSGAGPGTVPVATWLAALDPATLAVRSFERAPNAGAGLYGWSVVSDDEHSYLFGHCYRQYVHDVDGPGQFDATCMPHTRLARVPVGNFRAAPEFWTGSGWSTSEAAAVPVSSRGIANPMSVQWFGDVFVSVTKLDEWWGSKLLVDRAATPEGPWETVQEISVVHDRKCDDGCGNYGAFLLPWLDTSGQMTVALSNGGRFDYWRANAWLYRPTFYSVPLPTAPSPLAAANPPDFPVVAGDSGYVPVDPVRLVDTRQPGSAHPRARAGSTTIVDLGDVAPPGATAAVLNLTSATSADGFVSAHACDSPRPATSNLNPSRERVVTNAATVPLGDGRVCLYSYAATDLIVDLNGWLTTGSDIGLEPVTSRRLVDTRSSLGGRARLAAGETIEVPVDVAAEAVQLNVTAVAPAGTGYVTVWPCGAAMPVVSNLNPRAGETRPNLVNVRVGDGGRVCLFTSVETDLLVDLTAVYRSGAPARYAALAPQRLIDTRAGSRVTHASNVSVLQPLGDLVAAQVNVTVTRPAGAGYLTVYPCTADPLPDTSNVNFVAGEDAANSASMISRRGYGCVYSSAPSDVIVDLFGTWR